MKFLALLLVATTVMAGHPVHWGYSGDIGPEYWGELDESFITCANGQEQSPVDVSGNIQQADIIFNYQSGGINVVNNGHTVKVNYQKGSTITINGNTFELLQFHFHAPSENYITGKSYPMELHLVHKDAQGHLAVVGVMIEEGEANTEMEKVYMPHMDIHEDIHTVHMLAEPVDATALLPSEQSHYTFQGSLTTPPCSEGVLWLLMDNSITFSKQQIEAFKHAMGHQNNRPVQRLMNVD